ncbi:MAG TPA: hypothetical protein VK509_21755 [Polyangiales bacterium]|nr:hypothetical protein [Polyangiales bacterium]
MLHLARGHGSVAGFVRGAACGALLATVALGCSDRIAVLGPSALEQSADDGGSARDDAGPARPPMMREDAGDPPPSQAGSGGRGGMTGSTTGGSISTGALDGGQPPAAPPCDLECGPNELCTYARCVPAQGVMSLSSWLGHSCAVEAGRLYCWGPNGSGQLGLGDRDNRNRRTRVGSDNDWLAVAVGEHFSCGIRAPGQLYCWGANNVGQLGVGDLVERMVPTAVPGAQRVVQIAAGGASACARDEGDALWCWGDNLEGKPGQGDGYGSPDVVSPARVGSDRWKLVAVGQGHVCAVRADGRVLCWGRNSQLELGLGSDEPGQTREPTETMITGTYVSLSASQHHSCGVRDDGTLWCWGGNEHSELAVPSADLPRSGVPVQVGTESDWAEASVGWFHSCARKQNGALFCWGRAIEGQLAQDRIDPNPMPVKVPAPVQWQRISTGNFHSCGVDMQGALHCTGENGNGQLGLGDLTRRHAFEALP